MSIEEFNSISHLMIDYVEKFAAERPDEIAIIDADDGKFITWEELNNMVNIFALGFHDMGFQKGDIVVTMLPLLMEHIYGMPTGEKKRYTNWTPPVILSHPSTHQLIIQLDLLLMVNSYGLLICIMEKYIE